MPATARVAAALCLLSAAAVSAAHTPCLDPVTALATGALSGQNVNTAVPGFELLILRDGREVYRRSFGTWSLDRPANADSSTKTLSGALIMSLIDSSPRPFTLQSRLSEFIPSFDGAMQNITIGQCFSHTAGFGDSTAVARFGITLQQAALDISNDTLAFPPGSTFSYGGTSMHAAGAAAEVAGGAAWSTLFSQRLNGPLGMASTRFVLSGPTNPRIAGGCESTARDFGALMEMLRRGGLHGSTRILSESSTRAMFTRQSPLGVPVANSPLPGSSDYGVGVWLDERDAGGRLVGALAGGARGFCSWIDFDDRMVGVIATDLTSFSNIRDLQYLIREAAQIAFRTCCPADTSAEGVVAVDDLFTFLSDWFAAPPGPCPAGFAGCTGDFDRSATVTVDDLFAYLTAWFEGC